MLTVSLPNAAKDSYTKEMMTGRVSVLSLIFNKAGRPTKVSAQLLPSIPGKPKEKNARVMREVLLSVSVSVKLHFSVLRRLHGADCKREVWR